MRNRTLVEKWNYVIILFVGLLVFQVHGHDRSISDQIEVKGEAPKPRRGYPKEVAYVKTPLKLVSALIATIESPPTPLAQLPKLTEVDEDWKHAKLGDEIYDVTSWFPLSEMRVRFTDKEDRWVYYNRTTGYIFANADQFLTASINNFVSDSIAWSGFKSRLQVIYLEVGDEVELNLDAIQRFAHKVLLRGSTILKTTDWSEAPFDTRFGSLLGVECHASVKADRGQGSYWVDLRLQKNQLTIYENLEHIGANHWVIYECGVSEKGKRKVLAIRVDHVNHSGEYVRYPLSRVSRMDFDARLINSPDSLLEKNSSVYKAYKVIPDLFHTLGPTDTDIKPNMTDVSEIISRSWVEVDARFFEKESLLIARCSEENHKILADNLDDSRGGNGFP